MASLNRAFAILSALLFLVLEIAASVDAVPAPLASSPSFDGRPTLSAVVPAPRWTPPDAGQLVLVRYEGANHPCYGLVDGGSVLELSSSLYEYPRPTGLVHRISELDLLPPIAGGEVESIVVLARDGGLEPLRPNHMLGPVASWRLTEGVRCSSQRAVIHVPGFSSQMPARVGVTCGLLLSSPDGDVALVSGPTLVVGGVAAESRVDPTTLQELSPGTVLVELLQGPQKVEVGSIESTLGGVGSLVVRVT